MEGYALHVSGEKERNSSQAIANRYIKNIEFA
jgi:hypothetical protein